MKPRSEAKELLKWYWQFHDKAKSLPIDVVDIIRRLGIFIFEAQFEDRYNKDLSGYINRVEDTYEIVVNQKHLPQRKRFTAAHELGHRLLHPDIIEVMTDGKYFLQRHKRNSSIEKQANAFASELLMPEELVRREHRQLLYPTTVELAKIFAVSPNSMHWRLRELGLVVR